MSEVDNTPQPGGICDFFGFFTLGGIGGIGALVKMDKLMGLVPANQHLRCVGRRGRDLSDYTKRKGGVNPPIGLDPTK